MRTRRLTWMTLRPCFTTLTSVLCAACGEDVANQSRASAPSDQSSGAASASAHAPAAVSAPATQVVVPPTSSVSAATAAVSAAPLDIAAPDLPWRELRGVLLYDAQLEGDEGTALYVVRFEGGALAPAPMRLFLAAPDGGALGWYDASVAHAKVVFTTKKAGGPGEHQGQLWVMPLGGGRATPVLRCEDRCDTPFVLPDGRIVYVDRGFGGTNSRVKLLAMNPGGAPDHTTLFFSPEMKSCSVELAASADRGVLAIDVDNELGWPDCSTDATWLTRTNELAPKKLARPAVTRGYCSPSFEGGRLHLDGYECEPKISFALDGSDPKNPDPLAAVPTARAAWSFALVDRRIVAVPPAGSDARPFVAVRGDVERLLVAQ